MIQFSLSLLTLPFIGRDFLSKKHGIPKIGFFPVIE